MSPQLLWHHHASDFERAGAESPTMTAFPPPVNPERAISVALLSCKVFVGHQVERRRPNFPTRQSLGVDAG